MKNVRVRYAPSPTGPLHLGGARTALFNFIFAKQKKGVFILRFEDTDKKRSQEKFVKNIKEGLRWLGITWDEEYFQSKRRSIYEKYLKKLLNEGRTYRKEGAVYFRIPEGRRVEFKDLIRGKVSFERRSLKDFVLIKKDGSPTFHFGNVVDDAEMRITHVIRGEDHLSNTPLHLLLYQALGKKPPLFAHIPLILNPDRSKMSKRTGEIDLKDYQKKGYLPEAMVNFLVQLGWSSKNNREIFTLKELIKIFSLKQIQKSGAVFDIKYLDFLNHYYLQQKSVAEYFLLAKPFLGKYSAKNSEYLKKVLRLTQERAETLSAIPRLISYFFKTPLYPTKRLIFRKSDLKRTKEGLIAAYEILSSLGAAEWSEQKINQALSRATAKAMLSPGDVFWPVRVALSGREGSPGPHEIAYVLGQKETLKRIKSALKKLGNKS